jgi:hypothetical protein
MLFGLKRNVYGVFTFESYYYGRAYVYKKVLIIIIMYSLP